MGHTNFPSITLSPMGFQVYVPCSSHGTRLEVACVWKRVCRVCGRRTTLNCAGCGGVCLHLDHCYDAAHDYYLQHFEIVSKNLVHCDPGDCRGITCNILRP